MGIINCVIKYYYKSFLSRIFSNEDDENCNDVEAMMTPMMLVKCCYVIKRSCVDTKQKRSRYRHIKTITNIYANAITNSDIVIKV